jgi:nitroreductase
MDVREAIAGRRSIKRFTDRVITRAEIEALLESAVRAPNHRMTQPWRFYVLGPESRRNYGVVLGARKARKVEDAEAAKQLATRVADENAGLPAVIAAVMQVADDPEIREEDQAATWMAVQNLLLAAWSMGLGTHVKTGAVMQEPAARAAVGVADNERIVALINLGEPAELPPEKPRRRATEVTVWRP